MKKSGTHGRASDLLTFNCKVEFLDSQVNGAVFMLQKSDGQVPVDTHSQIELKLQCTAQWRWRNIQSRMGVVLVPPLMFI